MSKRTLWRLIAVTLICIACGFFFIPLNKVKRGLDLSGGVHFQLEVQSHEALVADFKDQRDRLTSRLQEKGLSGAIVILEPAALRVQGVGGDQKPTLEKVLKESLGGYYKIAWDGDVAVITQEEGYQKMLKEDASKRALQIIEDRVNQFGLTEPEIMATGADGNRISVALPGITEAERERIKDLLSTPGRLEFRLMAKGIDEHGFPTREAALQAVGGTLPPDWEIVWEPENPHNQRVGTGRHARLPRGAAMPAAPKVKAADLKPFRWYVVQTRVEVDGGNVTEAHRSVNPTTEATEIAFTLNRVGGDQFYALTSRMVDEGRMMAILLDGKIVSVLGTSDKIHSGVRITGSFTPEEADDFALKLKSGSMRASLKFLEEKSQGPGLGADSIRAGVRAALLGFVTIVAFMVLWYHGSGVNAIVALSINTIVMLGLLGSLHAVLTLPGIAGFALTLGMAVDANILIYERIREELKAGKSVAGAIQAGFDRVFLTIVDSHVTQLAAALLLYSFGTPAVKGFAVTLTIGVIASLFTSIYISRYIYDWELEHWPNKKTLSIGTLTIFQNTKFPFMKYKAHALAASWGIVLLCAIWAQPWKGAAGRFHLGMEFTGGVDIMVRMKGDVTAESVRAALVKHGQGHSRLIDYRDKPGVTDFSVKQKATQASDKEATAQAKAIEKALVTLDPQLNDPRPDLNLLPSRDLVSRWKSSNPLGVQGDDDAKDKAYRDLAAKVNKAREDFAPMSSFDQLPQDLPAQLREDLAKNYRLGPMYVLKNESFSKAISGEWTEKTLMAVGLALAAILVYVFLRFTMSFAVGGVVALVHDVLMALGLFVLFGFEFSVPVVASFLILIGYSMADTIVVFDRIRENAHKPEYRRVPIAKLIDDSINQTLSRTILTSCSVLFVAACLFFWGGPALRDLSFPIFVGVITGTYSSIYIASPVVVYWDKWFGGKDKFKQHS